ncbi:MAG: SdrD B-like domain-containing protein [Acidimicrobiia bacterium]|nr:SdrD B-like domain-containing protein [Acidimicrobiia bacterium]
MSVNNRKRRYQRRFALLAAFALTVSVLPFDLAGIHLPAAQAGPAPVEIYLIPLPEEDIRNGSLALYSGTSESVRTVISVTGAVDGTIVYYDHWEDGFELDISAPAQATTETWGDGNVANGAPPGCSLDSCDTFGAGDNAALINDVFANPRDPVTVLYDGGDQVGTTAPVAVTRAGWALDPGTLLAGAVEVYPTDAWGTAYQLPFGVDSTLGANFEYTAASIMASAAGTTVTVDVDADTIVDQTLVVGAGESVLVPDLQQGATINSNGPIQVDLLTGDVGATYAGRWFALLPTTQWATSYFNPVGTVVGDDPATVALYNPGGSALTVDVSYQGGSTSVNVPADDAVAYQMPGSGAEFSAASAFYATVAVDYDGTTHDWGFTLVPETRLTTAAVVGWGPGSDNPGAENSSPVWVTAEGATTLYVDYDGDPTTGSSQDTNGDWYDQSISLAAYQMRRLYDSADNDQTGLKVYTLDGTRVAVAYGQDPSTASTGSPALDLGTAVVPLLLVAMGKIGSLSGDTNGNGALDPGEFITYTVTIRNDGTADINPSVFSDALDPQTTYVPNTATVDAAPYPDAGSTPFPFDEGGQDLGLITAGQVVVITYDVQLNDPLPDGINTIVNNAQLNSIGISIEGTSILPVFDPFLDITKTSDVPPEGAIPGDTVTYTIVVENTSDTPQDGFTLADNVPVGTTYVAESTSVTGPVVTADTYADDMQSGGYGGSTGSRFWGPDWTEINESDGPNSGDERIVNSSGSLRLRVQDNDGNGEGVSRAVNLAGYDRATLSFDFARSGFDNPDDFVVLEATDGSGSWDELARWEGPGSDPVFLATSHSLNDYLTTGAAIRFLTSQDLGGSDRFLIDNVVITAETVTVETRTNASSDPTPLVAGTAPDLLIPADPFALDPGETMTITYQATLANPLIPNLTEITNTAYVASRQQPIFTTDDVTDPIAFPAVDLAKSLLSNADEDGSADVSVGDTLTYRFIAENVGDTDLSNVTIADPMTGLSALSCSPVQPAALATGQTMTCTATYTVTQADVNTSRIDNTATMSAVDPADRPVVANASETVPINHVPAITVVKSLLTDLAGIGAGDTFDYEFVVTNTGNVDLANVLVTDPLVGGPVGCPQSTLSPNESMTCTAAYTVTQMDIDVGHIANTASVTAEDPNSQPVTDEDDEMAILEQNPSIDLAKALLSNADEDGSGDTSIGDTLTYEFVATNDGNITLNNVVVGDPLPGLSALSCAPGAGTPLAPTEQMTCSASYTVTQTDIDAGSIDNTATVTGISAGGKEVTDSASESVSAAQNPSITLIKSLAANADEDLSGDVTLNDTLTYQFTVVNDGNVTLSVVNITDPLPGLSAFSCGPDTLPVTLVPSDMVSCTATYVVTQPDVDAGRIDNTATATGQQPSGQPISDDDDETVLPDRNPSIDLAKTVFGNADEDGSGDVSLGDTLTYQFVATNDGDVGLDNVVVTDPLPGMSALSCVPVAGSSLAPATAVTCSATYSVSQADVDAGQIVNTATAVGDDSGGGGSVMDQDSASTTTAQNPSVSIVKRFQSNADEDGSGDISRNDTLTYELTVENQGDVTLSNVAVDDPLTGGPVTCPQTALMPGESMVCTTNHVVTQSDIDAGSISNTATAAAEDPQGNPVTDDDDELVSPPQNPSIVLVKSLLSNADEDGSGSLSTGDTITYRFVATNDGDVTLDLVVITDPMPGLSPLSCAPAAGSSLATGAAIACTATYSVNQADVDAGSIDNTATVVAERPGGNPGDSGDDVTDTDNHLVLIPAEPAIDLTKSMTGNADEDASGDVTVGDTLSYDFVVENTGNVTLSSVGVADPLIAGVVCPLTVLAPGETTTCTGAHTVTLDDANTGFVVNTATATGTDPNGTDVTDDDAVATPVETGPAITLVKGLLLNADEDGSGGVSIADTLTYSFVATNNGDVTLSAVRVFDPLPGLSAISCAPALPAVLAPGESISCVATYTVTQTNVDQGQILNTATADGLAPDSSLVSATDGETVLIAQIPSISLDKFVAGNADEDGSGGITRDDTLTYQFEATNTGNVTLTGVTISDPLPGLGAFSCVPAQPATLLPGDSLICTADYVVTQIDVDNTQIFNTATAMGTDPDSATVSDDDTVVTPIEGGPAITLDKSLAGNADEDGTGDVSIGDTLTYQFDVENTGDTSLTNVTVTDPLPGLGTVGCVPAQGSTLAPTATMTCAATYTVTAADAAAGQIDNTATVVGLAPAGTPTSADDSETVLTARADLSLFKSVSDPTPNVGDVVTFILSLVNDGPDTATNVDVVDVLPSGYSYQAGSISGGDSRSDSSAPLLNWTVDALSSGTSVNLTFSAIVQAPTGAADEYLNIAEVAATDTLDPDSTPGNDDGDQSEDDEDSASVTPQSADLSVVKSVSDTTPNVGDTVTFTITVWNGGPDDATGVSVEDRVPAGYSGISNISSGGTAVGSTVTWAGLSVASGGSTAVTFDAVVAAPPADYNNVAEVTASDQHDPDSTPGNDDGDQSEDDEDSVDLIPQVADLSLSKIVSNPAPNVGDTVTFTITVSNAGPDGAAGVAVEDVVPAGYSGISNVSSGGTAVGATVTWNGLSVSSGASISITFDALVEAPPTDYVNIAEVTAADQHDPDSTPDNDDGDQSEDDEDSASVAPQSSDLSLNKVVSGTTPNVGDTVTFTITVTNAGPDHATGVAVEDVVPAGYSTVGNISAGGSLVGSTVAWSGLAVPAGGSTVLTFDVVVEAPPADHNNVAQLTAADQHDPDSTPANDDGDQSEDDEDNASVVPQVADLSLVKAVSDPAPNVGDIVTFAITVTNAGPDDATGVSIVDPLPTGYSYQSGSMAGGVAQDETGAPTLRWTVGTLSAGSSVVLTFAAGVDAPSGAPGEYTNAAEVASSDQHDPDSTPANDDGDQSEDDEDNASVVPQSADLSLVKAVSDATPNIGETVTFTITLSNAGPDDASGVAVADVVPDGYSGVFNVSSGGALVGSTIGWSGLNIATGASVDLTFEAVVDAPPADYVNIAQITAADQHDPDSSPDNDDGDQSEDDEDRAAAAPQVADLSLDKSVSNSAPNLGEVVTFTIVVNNDGPDDATGVAVEDVVPVGFSGIANVSSGGALVGSTITWSGLSVAAGGSATVTFDATIEAPPTDYVNVAQVTAVNQFDPDSTPDNDDGDQSEDDEDSAAVVPQAADLSLNKVVSGPAPNVGETVTFTITVTNAGPDDATGVSIEDDLPVGYSGISNISSGGTLVGSTVIWSGLGVPAGGSVVVTFDALVDALPTDYVNIAEVTAADQHDPDSTPDNDDGDQSEDDEDNAAVIPAVIGLAKSVAGAVNNGDGTYTVVYLLTFENLGGVTISDLEIYDDVTTQLALLAPTGFAATDGTYVANLAWDGTAGSNILSPGQTIDPGEIGNVRISFSVIPGPDVGPHENTAVVVGSTPTGGTVTDDSTVGIDPDTDGDGMPDEEDPTPVSFDEGPALGIAKVVSGAPVSNGDGSYDLTYTLLIQNYGDVVLTEIQVTDDLATTFTTVESWLLVSATSEDLAVSPTYDGATDVWLLAGNDTMPVGSSATIDVTVRVTPAGELGPHWNSATVQGVSPADTTLSDISQDGADPDPDGNNDPSDNNDPTPIVFPNIGSVAGTVWKDADADTAIGGDETGLKGVLVSLVDPGPDGEVGSADDAMVATAVTATDGSFTFAGVPAGAYVVVVDPTTLPPLMQATFDPDGYLDHMTSVNVAAGEVSTDNDFGYVPGFNLWLTKTSHGGEQVGERVEYVITVGNDGPGPALGPITVRDVVPAALPITGVSGDDWTCSILDQTVDCVLDGDLGPDAESIITIATVISGSATGAIDNTADVESDGPIVEPDMTDNSDVDTVSIGELPRTGTDVVRFAVFGLLLLFAGAALVIGARRATASDRQAGRSRRP